jgi:hypothetical protein
VTPFRRWCVVALGTLLLIGVPIGLRALPAAESDVSAATLLERVQGSQDAGWSGYVETEGTLQLPDADRFSDVGALFGESTALRAWWRDAEHWRVDQLLLTGERDLIHDGGRTTAWDYERAEATVSRDPDIRLPRSADLVPPELARRFLGGVVHDDVRRLDTRRIAGVSAPGLRIVPSSELSSIDHVDLWADPDSGVALRVEVFADDGKPSFTSTFREYDGDRPPAGDVDFTPTPSTDVEFDDVLDIADAANQYAPLRPPRSVAGLAKSESSDRAVGVYGEGLTQVIAIPLRDREADALRDQLAVTPGVERSDEGAGRTLVTVGPLGVVLTGTAGEGGWLLAGTLNRDGLVRAADDVVRGFRYVGRG